MAAPTLRQFNSINNTSTSIPFSSNLTANSFIVIGIATAGGAAISSVGSSAGNTYTLLNSGATGFGLYTGPNIKGAVAETITITAVGGVNSFVVIAEITGTFAPTSISGFTPLNNYTGTSITFNNLPTTSANTLMLLISGFASITTPVTPTGAYSGFVVNIAATSNGAFLISGTESTVGTFNPTFTVGSNANLFLYGIALASQAAANIGSRSWLTVANANMLRGSHSH